MMQPLSRVWSPGRLLPIARLTGRTWRGIGHLQCKTKTDQSAEGLASHLKRPDVGKHQFYSNNYPGQSWQTAFWDLSTCRSVAAALGSVPLIEGRSSWCIRFASASVDCRWSRCVLAFGSKCPIHLNILLASAVCNRLGCRKNSRVSAARQLCLGEDVQGCVGQYYDGDQG